jgi:hypothetical protein
MVRVVAIFLVSAGLAGCSGGFNTAPTSQAQPTGVYARPGIPQSQYECLTDDGYGRSRPCSDTH